MNSSSRCGGQDKYVCHILDFEVPRGARFAKCDTRPMRCFSKVEFEMSITLDRDSSQRRRYYRVFRPPTSGFFCDSYPELDGAASLECGIWFAHAKYKHSPAPTDNAISLPQPHLVLHPPQPRRKQKIHPNHVTDDVSNRKSTSPRLRAYL